MNKLHHILIITLLAFSNSAVASLDDVKGAFGIKFGEVLDEKELFDCEVMDDVKNCNINPPIPYYAFNKYRVFLTPTENKVFKIIGLNISDDGASSCLSVASNIATVLNSKYEVKMKYSELRYPDKKLFQANWETPSDKHKSIKMIYMVGVDISPHEENKSTKELKTLITVVYEDKGITREDEVEKIKDDHDTTGL